MANHNNKQVKIDKKKEKRTKEISKMISEGGLGADRYYDIEKSYTKSKKEIDNQKDKI